MNLHDIFGKCPGPVRKDLDFLDRYDRIAKIGEWFEAVIDKRQPDPDTTLWLAFSLAAHFNAKEKTSLTRDHLKIAPGNGDTQHAAKVWQRLKNASLRAKLFSQDSPTMESSTNQEDRQQ